MTCTLPSLFGRSGRLGFAVRRPDQTATADPMLELMLPDAALLTELDPATLTPGLLPRLWHAGEVSWPTPAGYFSGQ